MRTLPKVGAIGAALALTAAGLFGAATAGADSVDISAPLESPSSLTLSIPALTMTGTIPAPDGSNFAGTWDNSSGDLTGALTIADGSFTTDVGGNPVTIGFSFSENGGGITNGSIDPTTGDVAFDDSQTFHITSALGAPVTDCAIGPVDLHFTGTYDETSGLVDVTADPVSVGTATGACSPIGADTINGILAGATAGAHVVFTAGVKPVPPTSTPTTVPPTTGAPTTTVPAKAAPAAKAVSATPSYTG